MKIKAVELDNGEWVYMQVDDGLDMDTPQSSKQPVMRGGGRGGFESKGFAAEAAENVASSLHGVVKAVANTTLNALRDSIGANVDKVTLEFGITMGGSAGVPFVTSGKAEGSVKVKVECSFPEREA